MSLYILFYRWFNELNLYIYLLSITKKPPGSAAGNYAFTDVNYFIVRLELVFIKTKIF